MDHRFLIAIVIAVIVLLAAWFMAGYFARRRRTELLQRRFGPEYERAVREIGTNRAEATLLEREKRVEKLSIRELTPDERERFITEWRLVQLRFVEAPHEAVIDADRLVEQLMATRGYPVTNFEQRAADISVDHPRVVDNYRAAHQIALRHRHGEATTEDLRKAILYYRSLFDDLLHTELVATNRREVA